MKKISKNYNIPFFFFVVTLALFVVFQIVTITQENNLAQKYQREIDSILGESFSSVSTNGLSLDEIRRKAEEKGFARDGLVTYVEVSGTEVVVR